jgi:hypothetical protein
LERSSRLALVLLLAASAAAGALAMLGASTLAHLLGASVLSQLSQRPLGSSSSLRLASPLVPHPLLIQLRQEGVAGGC